MLTFYGIVSKICMAVIKVVNMLSLSWTLKGPRKKSYYLLNIPLKRSISAEKEVHGPGKSVPLSRSPTYPRSSYREYTV